MTPILPLPGPAAVPSRPPAWLDLQMACGPLLADAWGNRFLVVAAVAALGALASFWWMSRVAPKGTVLAVAVCLYVASILITPGNSRELHGLVGILRLLGFAGGVLGLFDLLRKRQPPHRENADATG